MAWLRWHEGTVYDPKFMVVSRKSGQPVGFVLAVWAMLLERASCADERGTISGFDCESADAVMGMPDGAACAIVQAMQDKGIITEDLVCRWTERQPVRERGDEAPSTDRVRKHRERQKENRNANLENETPCNAMEHHETPRGEEIRREENIREDLNTPPYPPLGGDGVCVETSPEPDIAFEQVWQAYPELGRVDRQDAWKAYKAEVRRHGKAFSGPMRIMDAIADYAASVAWQEEGGRYIPHLKKFLSSGRYLEPPAPARPKSSAARDGSLAYTERDRQAQEGREIAEMLMASKAQKHGGSHAKPTLGAIGADAGAVSVAS